MDFFKKYTFAAAGMAAFLTLSACPKKEEPSYVRNMVVMNAPSHVRVFTPDEAEAKKIADAVFKELNRIAGDYNSGAPFTFTNYVNKKAYGEWVRVDDEFLKLLVLSMDYYNLTEGAFDITFAPLWPIWKEAAASKKMPSKEEINNALSSMGSEYVQLDHERKMIRFTRPVQINISGILRGYCLERGRVVIKQVMGENKYPVELRIGGDILSYGKKDWFYDVPDPFHAGRSLGRLRFEEGVVMASSSSDHFVQIEDKRYSHILDLRTGYPLADFSSLTVYFPAIEDYEYLPSAVLAVMGKRKAFALLGRLKGTAALWIDGSGNVETFFNGHSKVKWEKFKRLF